MKLIIKFLSLFIFLFFVAIFSSNAQISNNDSIDAKNKPVPSYYMVNSMNNNLPIDTNTKVNIIPSNKLVYYVRKNVSKNPETVIELVYKVGSLMEDSTKYAQAFFTANYVAKYYATVITNKFTGKISPIVNVESKPDYTKFLFSVVASDADKKVIIADFLKTLSDSISFNSKLLDVNKSEFISQYIQNQSSELQYTFGKQLKVKSLNTITITKLKQFYKDWYRPNLMSIVVVGDIDEMETQKSIATFFSTLKNPIKEKSVVYYGIPKKPSLQLIVVDDTLQTDTGSVQFYFKKFRNNRASSIGYIENTIGMIAAMMLNNVTNEHYKESNNTNKQTKITFEQYTKNEDAIVIKTTCNNNCMDVITIGLLGLNENLKDGGIFNEKQLYKAKSAYLNNLEKNKDTPTTSIDYATAFLNNFIYNLPLMDKEQELEFTKSFIEKFMEDNFMSFFADAFEQQNTSIIIKRPNGMKMNINNKLELLKLFNESHQKK